MTLKPSHLEINGVKYRLAQGEGNAYREYTEDLVQRQPEIAGSSRFGQSLRPDIHVWKMDNWSGGEGQKFVDPRDEFSFIRYQYSDGAVDVATPGQISLGLNLTDDTAGLGTITVGPHLAATNSYLAAVADVNGRRKNLSTGTWSALSVGGGGNVIGPVDQYGGYVWVGKAPADGAVRRVDPNANTNSQWSSEGGEQPIAADNRLYSINNPTTDIQLRRINLSGGGAGVAMTVVYTALGAAANAGLDAIGNRIYMATAKTGEEPVVHVFDGSEGQERARMPIGFRMDTTPFAGVTCLGDIVFLVGYREGATGQVDVPMLCYVAADRTGTLGIVREDIFSTATKFLCSAPGFGNRLVMGTDQGQGFIYDISTGGISQLFTGVPTTENITSITYAAGKYFFGARVKSGTTTGKVYATTPTGSGRYPASSVVYGATWDFGLPETEKILLDIEVHTDSLDAGTSVEVSFISDSGSEVTTDAAGATMAHSSGARTRFTVSNASTERTFRYLQPKMTLKTSNTANTPVVYSVTYRCLIADKVQFFEAVVDLSDEKATQRAPGAQRSGSSQLTVLRSLRDSTSNRLFTIKPLFSGPQPSLVRGTDLSYTVTLSDTDFQAYSPGEGTFKLKFRRV